MTRTFSILILFASFIMPVGAWDNEEAFRNQLKIARSAVSNMTARVAESEQAVAKARKPVENIQNKLTELNSQLTRVRELIEVKSRAKELVSRQLKRKIKKLEGDLQAAVDARKPTAVLVDIQRRKEAYRKTLNETLARYGYEDQLRRLAAKRRELEARIKAGQEALVVPTSELDFELKLLQDERDRLAKAEAALAKLLKEAPEKLKHIAPPYLAYVTIKRDGNEVYKAHWNEGTLAVDARIRTLEKAIIEQKREIAAYRGKIDTVSDYIIAQSKECDRQMALYQDALWWQAMETIYVETIGSAINIAMDFKSMGPYAFLVEAVDMGQKSFRGKLTANYGLPKGTYDRKSFGQVAGSRLGKEAWSKFGPKGYIKDTLKDSIKQLSGGKTLADGVTSRNLGKEWMAGTMKRGTMTTPIKSVADLKNLMRGKYLLKKGSHAVAKEAYDQLLSPNKLWETTKKRIAKACKSTEVAKFGVKVGVGIAKDYAKSASEQKRMKAWYAYVEADAVREAMLLNLKAIGLAREFDQFILGLMQEHMKELIAERDKSLERRDLKVMVSKKFDTGATYHFELEFTNKDIKVDAVSLGGKLVKVTSQNGSIWKGVLDLQELPDSGEISVLAQDMDSKKALDDPTTKAKYSATEEKWTGYESGVDVKHRVQLGDQKAARSFVFLIDCSGSMGDNGRMAKAIQAADTMFNSGKFQKNDEIALWVFRGGAIYRPVGFTQNHTAVLNAIKGLTPNGGTPLAAAIRRSGSYLYQSGEGKYKALIVLTDGEASGVDSAIRYVRKLQQQVDLHLQ